MILVLIPLAREMHALERALSATLGSPRANTVGKFKISEFDGLTLALGGLGKVQFAISTTYLAERMRPALVICAGAAGALREDIAIGEVIAATETIEHDFKSHLIARARPRFAGATLALDHVRALGGVRLAPIASGDEDVVSRVRAEEIARETGAAAVAWEGAGAARACRLHKISFVELRVVTDHAGAAARAEFEAHLNSCIARLGDVLMHLANCKWP